MVKHTVSLTEPQSERLELLANTLGISVSELMRRVVDTYFERIDSQKGSV